MDSMEKRKALLDKIKYISKGKNGRIMKSFAFIVKTERDGEKFVASGLVNDILDTLPNENSEVIKTDLVNDRLEIVAKDSEEGLFTITVIPITKTKLNEVKKSLKIETTLSKYLRIKAMIEEFNPN